MPRDVPSCASCSGVNSTAIFSRGCCTLWEVSACVMFCCEGAFCVLLVRTRT
jgi:hypothetical protein